MNTSPVKLLTVDAMNLVRRIYEANPAPDSEEKALGAVRSSKASLARALRTHQPTHSAFVLEGTGPTWRHLLYPAYKLGRKPASEYLTRALPGLLEELRGLGWALLQKPDFEADDVIASLAYEAGALAVEHEAPVEHVILTTDKDMLWCTTLGAKVFDHFTETWRDGPWLLEKMGIRAEQMLDYLALLGDQVDGIPGVDKVGKKTAATLLHTYGDLETVLANASAIGGKLGERLQTQAGTARLSRQLTGLRLDLFQGEEPLSWDALKAPRF